ncbi:MAG TPA: hypothetical protein VOA88_08475 [Candidatus Dormibacteraeota bacterium]|nr:hypothetical protein [Candidatus Dormibacteraeota bacterium]
MARVKREDVVRTPVALTKEQHTALAKMSKDEYTPMAALIRQAVDRFLHWKATGKEFDF